MLLSGRTSLGQTIQGLAGRFVFSPETPDETYIRSRIRKNSGSTPGMPPNSHESGYFKSRPLEMNRLTVRLAPLRFKLWRFDCRKSHAKMLESFFC